MISPILPNSTHLTDIDCHEYKPYFPGLRHRVFEFSQFRCGYCLTSQVIIGPYLEIEHIIPKAVGGTSDEENLIAACPHCNSRKSARTTARDPQTEKQQTLCNPRTDSWQDHFAWLADGSIIHGKTAMGRATIAALNMNHPDLVAARQLWVSAGWHPPKD